MVDATQPTGNKGKNAPPASSTSAAVRRSSGERVKADLRSTSQNDVPSATGAPPGRVSGRVSEAHVAEGGEEMARSDGMEKNKAAETVQGADVIGKTTRGAPDGGVGVGANGLVDDVNAQSRVQALVAASSEGSGRMSGSTSAPATVVSTPSSQKASAVASVPASNNLLSRASSTASKSHDGAGKVVNASSSEVIASRGTEASLGGRTKPKPAHVDGDPGNGEARGTDAGNQEAKGSKAKGSKAGDGAGAEEATSPNAADTEEMAVTTHDEKASGAGASDTQGNSAKEGSESRVDSDGHTPGVEGSDAKAIGSKPGGTKTIEASAAGVEVTETAGHDSKADGSAAGGKAEEHGLETSGAGLAEALTGTGGQGLLHLRPRSRDEYTRLIVEQFAKLMRELLLEARVSGEKHEEDSSATSATRREELGNSGVKQTVKHGKQARGGPESKEKECGSTWDRAPIDLGGPCKGDAVRQASTEDDEAAVDAGRRYPVADAGSQPEGSHPGVSGTGSAVGGAQDPSAMPHEPPTIEDVSSAGSVMQQSSVPSAAGADKMLKRNKKTPSPSSEDVASTSKASSLPPAAPKLSSASSVEEVALASQAPKKLQKGKRRLSERGEGEPLSSTSAVSPNADSRPGASAHVGAGSASHGSDNHTATDTNADNTARPAAGDHDDSMDDAQGKPSASKRLKRAAEDENWSRGERGERMEKVKNKKKSKSERTKGSASDGTAATMQGRMPVERDGDDPGADEYARESRNKGVGKSSKSGRGAGVATSGSEIPQSKTVSRGSDGEGSGNSGDFMTRVSKRMLLSKELEHPPRKFPKRRVELGNESLKVKTKPYMKPSFPGDIPKKPSRPGGPRPMGPTIPKKSRYVCRVCRVDRVSALIGVSTRVDWRVEFVSGCASWVMGIAPQAAPC